MKINDQKVANFFSIIGSIITTISIFLIYRQIQEVINDRKAQSLPKLFPEEYEFKLYIIESMEDPEDSKVKDFIIPYIEPELNFDEHKNALFSISNVGNGTAIDITVNWLYEMDEVKNAVENVYILAHDGLEEFDINYIKAGETGQGLYAPINYIQILGDKAKVKVTETILGNLELPKLGVNIEYSDLHGNRYERNKFFARVTKNGDNKFVMRFIPFKGN